jgi:hypothetical protein
MTHALVILEKPAGLVQHTPWGWRVGCACGAEQDPRGPRGSKKDGQRWYYRHREASGE